MSAFISIRPCDIINTTYKTYPAQTSIVLLEGADASEYRTSYYYLETEENFNVGQTRNIFDTDGNYTTGSWNLSGAIELIRNDGLTSREKRTINRLRNLYADTNFVRPQSYSSSSVFSASSADGQYMNIINIPSILYGTEIKPGSFKLDLSGANLLTELTDDGFGGIISSSVLIGSIYYQHGIVMLGHQSQAFEGDFDSSIIHFSGTNIVPMTMYVCTAPRGMLNYSGNTSFTVYNSSSNKYEITTEKNKTFVTTVGIYDENFELLAIAKVAKPILNDENGSIQFRLKLNY